MEFDASNILKFYKPFERRYEEFLSILQLEGVEFLTKSTVRERWSSFLEFKIEPTGWNAYWNILKKNCSDVGFDFPSIIFVQVNEVNFENLTAKVAECVTEDGDCKSVPMVGLAPLKDLYVTKMQKNSNLDINSTAECLDQLRIFYHHLWWPWDDVAYDGCVENWIDSKLENRLKLYYDKLEGKVHYISGKTIKRLMETNHEIFVIIREIKGRSTEENRTEEARFSADDLPNLFELYDRADTSTAELRQWELPEMRKLKDDAIRKANTVPGILMAISDCTILKAASYMQSFRMLLPSNEEIKIISPDIQECLLNYNSNDVLFVMPGNYEIRNAEYFDFPVTIKGVGQPEECVISDEFSFWSHFQSLASSVTIERVTFHLNFSRSVFIVKKGTLTIDRVNFKNILARNTRAILILNNATLLAHHCTFSHFDTAIVCMKGSTMKLYNCVFDENQSAVQFSEGAKICMENCDMVTSKDVPFRYESNSNDADQFESMEFLLGLEDINLDFINLSNRQMAVKFI